MNQTSNNAPQHPATLAGLYELVQIIESTLSLAHEKNPENEPLGKAWDLAIIAQDDAFDLLSSAGAPSGEAAAEASKAERLTIARQVDELSKRDNVPPADHLTAAMGEVIAMMAAGQNLSGWQRAVMTGFMALIWKRFGPVTGSTSLADMPVGGHS